MDLANAHQSTPTSETADSFLSRIDTLIDWAAIVTAESGDDSEALVPVPLFALKIALLKQWFGLSDAQAQSQVLDRTSFRAFLGFAGDGGSADVGILNELGFGAWSGGPAMAGKLAEVERQLRERGYAVHCGELREPSLMPRTEGGPDAPRPGPTALFDPGELGRMLEAVTAKAHAEGRDPTVPQLQQPRSDETSESQATEESSPHEERPPVRVVLEWPWGQTSELTGHLNVGRDHTFSPLALELTPYTHVSRKHAELLVYGDGVWLRDLGSRNGTYVNDEEVPKGQAYFIDADATLRFGPLLKVALKIFE